jgi:hypothetical protein
VTTEASWSSYLLTELELRAGNWALADQHAQAAATADASRAGNLQASTLLARALVDAHLGRVEHAREAAADGLKVARAGGERLFVWMHEAVLGFIALSLEDPLTAHRHLGPVVHGMHRSGFVEPALPAAAPDEIEALIAVGKLAAARTTLEELQRTAERLQRRWAIASAPAHCSPAARSSDGPANAAKRTKHLARPARCSLISTLRCGSPELTARHNDSTPWRRRPATERRRGDDLAVHTNIIHVHDDHTPTAPSSDRESSDATRNVPRPTKGAHSRVTDAASSRIRRGALTEPF